MADWQRSPSAYLVLQSGAVTTSLVCGVRTVRYTAVGLSYLFMFGTTKYDINCNVHCIVWTLPRVCDTGLPSDLCGETGEVGKEGDGGFHLGYCASSMVRGQNHDTRALRCADRSLPLEAGCERFKAREEEAEGVNARHR